MKKQLEAIFHSWKCVLCIPNYCPCNSHDIATTYLLCTAFCSFFPLWSWEVSPADCASSCLPTQWRLTLCFFDKGTEDWSIGLTVGASATWSKDITLCSANSFLVIAMCTDEWSWIKACFHHLTTRILKNSLAKFGKLTVLFIRVTHTYTAAI